jgi:phage baseplate assembly protein gpV
MSVASKITGLIESRIEKVNTFALGKITKVDLATWCVSIRLKNKIQDNEIELVNVPIALQAFGAGALHIAPAVGDIVLVGFSKYELQKQLRNRDIVAVNELVQHNLNHAIVLSGVHTESDTVPAVAANEIVITHKSGTYLKFCANGDLETNAPHLRFV